MRVTAGAGRGLTESPPPLGVADFPTVAQPSIRPRLPLTCVSGRADTAPGWEGNGVWAPARAEAANLHPGFESIATTRPQAPSALWAQGSRTGAPAHPDPGPRGPLSRPGHGLGTCISKTQGGLEVAPLLCAVSTSPAQGPAPPTPLLAFYPERDFQSEGVVKLCFCSRTGGKVRILLLFQM